MGQKVNPIGIRLGITRDWTSRWYANKRTFPVYILHQTLIVLLSQALLPLQWRPALEAPVLVLATLALSVAGFELVRRVPLLRPWFGLGPAKAD